MSRSLPLVLAAFAGVVAPLSTHAQAFPHILCPTHCLIETPLASPGLRWTNLLLRSQHSPDQRGSVDKALSGLTGEKASGPESKLLKVSIELTPGVRVKIGELLSLRIQSPIAGNLLVLNQEADGRTTQLYPNSMNAGPSRTEFVSRVEAGQMLILPAPGDRFQLRVTPPSGPNRIIAIVVPPDVPITDIVARNPNLRTIDNPAKLIEDLAQRARSTRGVAVEAISRAIGVLEWLVVP